MVMAEVVLEVLMVCELWTDGGGGSRARGDGGGNGARGDGANGGGAGAGYISLNTFTSTSP